MDKLTPELIWYVVLFLAPGFMASFWIGRYLPKSQGDTDGKSFLSYLALSVILYLPMILWLAYLHRLPYVGNWTNLRWLLATILLFPILLSMLFGWGIQRDWAGTFFRFFKLRPKKFVTTAWEEYFSRGPAVAVIVTLEDGRRIAGLFLGDDACASSDPLERDLFLPITCTVDDQMNWSITPRTAGILIKANKIAHMEFFKLQSSTDSSTAKPTR